MWRNWQTRRSQKPVMVTSWRFKSSHPHHSFKGESHGSPFSLCEALLRFADILLAFFVLDTIVASRTSRQ